MVSVTDKRSGSRASLKKTGRRAKSGVLVRNASGKIVKDKSSKTKNRYYHEIFSASPQARIEMIREGVPATEVKRIIVDLGVEQKVFFQALGLKTATVNRKAKENDQLTSGESERLLGVAKLVGQLEAIVADSGNPEGFDAPEWISRWLREPLPALGGKKPIGFLDTMEGQTLVSDALSRIQSGAYA